MKRSGIITLMTDFGLRDPYVAMMKGVILSLNPLARPVDVTHQIRAGSIFQGALLLSETYPFFPPGTVHVAVVDPSVGSDRRLIALEADNHFFVGPDNGIFWPILDNHDNSRAVQLTEERYFRSEMSYTFHGREVFAPVAAHLTLGVPLESLGSPIEDPVPLDTPVPREKEGVLYGEIVRVDNFGNLITNIHREVFEKFIASDPPVIEIKNLVVRKFGLTYADVDEGEPVALINSFQFLEIAVNLGRASHYLEKQPGEIIGTRVKVRKSGNAL
jgi:S-adenosylmethionine hydrolase